jgi:hypothetical protein
VANPNDVASSFNWDKMVLESRMVKVLLNFFIEPPNDFVFVINTFEHSAFTWGKYGTN